MNEYRVRLTFLTPLFSRGAYEERPEIRPPSIRGQLRWWFRALGGSYEEEKEVFGGIHNGTVSSKVVVRVSDISGKTGKALVLPHEPGKGEKTCWKPGSSFSLIITFRDEPRQKPKELFARALEAWLLMGALGSRATRAAGSFYWESQAFQQPKSKEEYLSRTGELLHGTRLICRVLEKVDNAEAARFMASDTIGGRNPSGQDDLSKIQYPLGSISPRRKTSPLRLRVCKIDEQLYLVAIWDGRRDDKKNLIKVADMMEQKKKKLAPLIKKEFT